MGKTRNFGSRSKLITTLDDPLATRFARRTILTLPATPPAPRFAWHGARFPPPPPPPITRYPVVGTGGSWEPGSPGAYRVRTVGYAKNGKIKKSPDFSVYECISVDHVKSRALIRDFGSRVTFPATQGVPREARGTHGSKLHLPAYLVVNLQMSGVKPSVFAPTTDSEGYNLAFSFKLGEVAMEMLRESVGRIPKAEDDERWKSIMLVNEWFKSAAVDPSVRGR